VVLIRVFALCVAGVVLLTSGIAAAASQEHPTAVTSSAGRCLKLPKPMIWALKQGLTKKARRNLRRIAAVKSHQHFSGLSNGFKKGAYFVSAKVRHFGIATWIADQSAFKTGGGFIAAVNKTARRVSDFGSLFTPSTLASYGITKGADGYRQSRACVR
jgi:hypothetical protein